MDQQVLRPVLYILLRCRRGSVPADPSVNVIGKPLVALREVLRDDKPVAPHRPTIFDRERIRLVRPHFLQKNWGNYRDDSQLRQYCSSWEHSPLERIWTTCERAYEDEMS